MISSALLKKIWKLSWPAILTNVMQTSITIIDTYMIGQLGPTDIAAVGMSNTIRLLVLISMLSVTGGAMSLMAQAKGGRDPKRMSLVTRQSIVSALILSVGIAAIGIILTRPLLILMSGEDGEVVALGAQYLYVIFLGTPFVTLNFTANRLMQGAGDMRTPMYHMVLLLIMNVFFNYVFIYGWGSIPAFGIVGAAIGTILARSLLSILQLWLFYSGNNVVKILSGTWKPQLIMVKDILSIGVPSGIQGMFRHGANIVLMGVISATSLGIYGAAALAICTQIEAVVTQTAVGLNVAASALVGQALGRWQPDEAYRNGTVMVVIGCISMAILIIPILIFSEELVLLFDPSANSAILAGSLSYLATNTLFLPVSGFGILLSGALRGSGDTMPAMRSAIIGRNITALSCAYLLAFPLGMDYWGVWIGVIIGRVVDSIYMWVVWKRRHWQEVALKKSEIYRAHLYKLSPSALKQFLNEIRGPQMAIAGTIEMVDDDRVTYERVHERVVHEFR